MTAVVVVVVRMAQVVQVRKVITAAIPVMSLMAAEAGGWVVRVDNLGMTEKTVGVATAVQAWIYPLTKPMFTRADMTAVMMDTTQVVATEELLIILDGRIVQMDKGTAAGHLITEVTTDTTDYW
jgi:hypothetical protein